MLKLDLKRIFFIISFLVYWIFTIIYIVTRSKNVVSYILLYAMLFLPLTFTIIFKYDVGALFILILYGVVQILLSILSIISLLSQYQADSLLLIVSSFIYLLFFVFVLMEIIKIIRNKEYTLKYYVLILGIIQLIITIINFIIAKDFQHLLIYDLIRTIVLSAIIIVYIYTFPKIPIKIFKDSE